MDGFELPPEDAVREPHEERTVSLARRVAVVLGNDPLLVDELRRTTEQASPTGAVRYYPPDGADHRTDMLRAAIAVIGRLEILPDSEIGGWMDAAEII